MENIKNAEDLRKELLARVIELKELQIARDIKRVEVLKARTAKEKDKDINEYNQDVIFTLEGKIKRDKEELNELRLSTPEEYVTMRVTGEINRANESIEQYTKTLMLKKLPDWSIENCVEEVKREIEELMEEKKIPAPKSYKKREARIEELIQTPEWQEKIQAKIAEAYNRMRKNAEESRAEAEKVIATAKPDSEEYLKGAIEEVKDWTGSVKEALARLDIVALFKITSKNKEVRREEGFYGSKNVVKVLAQIPPEEYQSKVRPLIEKKVNEVLKSYDKDKREKITKSVMQSLGIAANYLVATPAAAMGFAAAGVFLGEAMDSTTAMAIGAATGGLAGLTGGIYGTIKLGKKFEKRDIEVDIDKYINKALEELLIEAGYMTKEEQSKPNANTQPGQA